MCRPNEDDAGMTTKKTKAKTGSGGTTTAKLLATKPQHRRGKRDKDGEYTLTTTTTTTIPKKPKKKRSKALQKHGRDNPSGGLESLVPSLIGVAVLVIAVMAQRGFRGRASVAGIDLGTTNSVICVQRPSKGVGEIDCIADPLSGSPIIPSVVSVYDLQKEAAEIKVGPSSKTKTLLDPHPTRVVVGHAAKKRIDTHPHQTLFNAKRVLGRPYDDTAVDELKREVEFKIELEEESLESLFRVDHGVSLSPQQVGGYVVHHLMTLAREFLGHDNVRSAVLAVPAKFDAHQRRRTFEAFKLAGVTVARVLEEPTAAALAYGLHKKEGVEKILVYDFGGGTLDISILHVSEGYCDVMGSDGDDRLGGADFDTSVAHLLTEQHSSVLKSLASYEGQNDDDVAEFLASSCETITDDLPLCSVSSFHTLGEKVKISLSEQQTEQLETHGRIADEDAIVARAKCLALPPVSPETKSAPAKSLCASLYEETLEVSLKEYNTVCQPLFDRSVRPATRLIEDLTLQIEEIDEIVMVGGTTRMPQIRELVRQAFPKAQLNTHIDPDVTVAYGAASVID
jgi:molecular chaperone DnaK (HSP70)